MIDICVTGAQKTLGGTTGFYTGARQRLYNFGWTGGPSNCPATGTVGSSAALKWSLHLQTASVTVTGLGCNGLTVATSGTGAPGHQLHRRHQQHRPLERGLQHGHRRVAVRARLRPRRDRRPGCFVYCNPLLILGNTPKFAGTVPKDKNLICLRLCLQFFCLDRSYAGGIATSPNILLIPGN